MLQTFSLLDDFTASVNTIKSYDAEVFMIDVINDGSNDVIIPQGTLNITLKTGENRNIHLGGVKQFTIEADGDFRCTVYTRI